MPFDVFSMAAVADDLRVSKGARIDKVIQPSELSIAMRIWGRGGGGSIVISAEAQASCIYLTEAKLAKGFDTPSPFLMLLRKYCTTARIEDIRQAHLERVLFLDLSGQEFGRVTIVVETMGKRSNVILMDDAGEILGAIKLIGSHQSRIRRILPHVSYILPPTQSFGDLIPDTGPKLDPLNAVDLDRADSLLEKSSPSAPLQQALVGLLLGCSPQIAADIAARAGFEGSNHLGSIDIQPLTSAIQEQYALLSTHEWKPILIRRDGIPEDYRAYDVPPVQGMEAAPTMSQAVETVAAISQSRDALASTRRTVGALVERRRGEVEARIASLERGLAAASGSEELLNMGNMILGYQYSLAAGADRLEIPEMDLSIRLDPQLSPVENAERYFKRYRKARDAANRVPELLEIARHDLEFVEELETYIALAENPQDLTRVESDLSSQFGSRGPSKKRPVAPGKPLTFSLSDGRQVVAGRNARQNEEVTFKIAGRGDLWFHALGVPGSHTILRGGVAHSVEEVDAESDDGVQAAASLAAYYSKARSEKAVDVIMARVRDVHRIPGGAPGQVTYRNGRTVRVRPGKPEEGSSR